MRAMLEGGRVLCASMLAHAHAVAWRPCLPKGAQAGWPRRYSGDRSVQR